MMMMIRKIATGALMAVGAATLSFGAAAPALAGSAIEMDDRSDAVTPVVMDLSCGFYKGHGSDGWTDIHYKHCGDFPVVVRAFGFFGVTLFEQCVPANGDVFIGDYPQVQGADSDGTPC